MATTSEAPDQIQEEQEALSLNIAFQTYVRQLPQDVKRAAQPEIAKFVRWIGAVSYTHLTLPTKRIV